jgi:OmpA-OmpF porin, OOP family
MSLRRYILPCAFAIAPVSGFAEIENPYIGGGGGLNYPERQSLGPGQGSVNFDDGGLGAILLGFQHGGTGLRSELEFTTRNNSGEEPAPGEAGDGSGDVESMMVNLWYDFAPLTFAPRLRPFIGAGAGLADVDFGGMVDANGTPRGGSQEVSAYQGGAGVGYAATRRMTLSLAWRHFGTEKADFTEGGNLERYRANGVLAGLRYAFGDRPKQPPPMVEAEKPVEVVASEPADVAAFETIVLRAVNFQFDKAELTGPARETLDSVAARLTAKDGLSILIEGHTDAFGSDEYNAKLGQDRAEAVRRHLVERGVKPDSIEVVSRGEQEPAASNQTEEGRAHNRRVELEPREETPANVKIVVEPPTPQSIEAAKPGDPGGVPAE